MAISAVTWEELLERYRSLGGVAENVRLATGPRGRGVFVVDPGVPARLFTPPTMYVPVESIVIEEGRMTTNASEVGGRERDFFERYQQYFGWGTGGVDEGWQLQAMWHALPVEISNAIGAIGGIEHPQWRFLPPSIAFARDNYLKARLFNVNKRSYIVPMIDLVNHSASAQSYGCDGGLSVSGQFADEVLVSYSSADAWGQLMNYGFNTTSRFAYSVGINVGLPNGCKLSIARNVSITVSGNRMGFPQIEQQGDTMVLSYLLLGYTQGTDLPRAVFRKLLSGQLDTAAADRVFDGIQHYNRTQFISLMRKLREYDDPFIRRIEDAILSHLETLSACIGARSL